MKKWYSVLVLLIALLACAGAKPMTVAKIQTTEMPLPLQANSTHQVVCLAKTYPRPFPAMFWFTGHTTIILDQGNGTVITAGLTGKPGQPKSCFADNLLVNRNCKYHKNIPVIIQKCSHISGNQVVKLMDSIVKTHDEDFQKGYSLLFWNCVIWASETWNSLGLPTVSWVLPIPDFIN